MPESTGGGGAGVPTATFELLSSIRNGSPMSCCEHYENDQTEYPVDSV